MGSICFGEEELPVKQESPKPPIDEKESEEDILARKQRAEKRTAAIKELIDTEKTYVEGLKLCIHAYYNGLSQDTKIIPTNHLKEIFNDVEMIYKLNQTFLDDLESRYNSFDNNKTMIGDRFVEFTPYFKMYQNYCNKYDNATVLMNKYCEKEIFTNILSEIRDKCDGKTLNGLLILPIQRLPRYRLCLSEIIKNTETYHPDLKNLNNALELVEKTTSLINERMKEFEQRQKVRNIESRFKNDRKKTLDLVLPHRKFIKEGIMTKVNKTGKDQIYIFFLFNDMICYASMKKELLKMHTILPIDCSFYVKDIKYHNKYKHLSFEIHSSVKSFIVYCNNLNEKQKWINNINKIIENSLRELQSELAAPLMVADELSDICQIDGCNVKFTFVNRKHHCRFCGKLICGKCGKYKLESKVNKNNMVRVCKICYQQFCNVYHGKNNGKYEQCVMTDIDHDQRTENIIISK
eukprot:7148_1